MNVTLPPELEAMVRERIDSGRYHDVGEVVREALRQLAERERRLDELHAALAIGEEQIARGEVVEWTPELRDQIWREAKAAAKAGKQPKADVVP
jgi:antitoxin ParD1/3/4